MSLTPLQQMVPYHRRGPAEFPHQAFPSEDFKAEGENQRFPGSKF